MDDTVQTDTWQQPNTFMDIIAPSRVKNPLPKPLARSETLMRTAVKKPEAVQPSPHTIEVTSEPLENQFSDQLNTARPNHTEAANLTDRSPLVSRFSTNSDLAEAEQPQYPSMDAPSQLNLGPDLAVSEAPLASQTMELAIEQPSVGNIFSSSLPADLSYSQTPSSATKNKWHMAKRLSGWTVLAVVLIGLVGAGIFVNSNFSKLELYLASSKAGFSATLPSIKPSGFDLSSISTGSGVIQASFKSNSDSRAYSIGEHKSSITTNQLLNGYVLQKAGQNYQTIQTEGKTIYVYDGEDATWVSHGIWYVISDNNSLSNHQIIDIADSM